MSIFRTIFEIRRTEVPEFTDGIYKCPWAHGCKIKSTSSGQLMVRLIDDPPGQYRTLSISGTNTWDLPDVIGEIKEDASNTIDLANVLVGTDSTE